MGAREVTGSLPSAEVAGVPPLAAPKPLPVGHSTAPVTSFHCRRRGGAGDSGDRRERPARDMLTWKASLAMARGAGGGAGAAGQALDAPTPPPPSKWLYDLERSLSPGFSLLICKTRG